MPNLTDLIGNYFNLQNTIIEAKIAGKDADFGCDISSLEFDASTNGEASICTVRWISDCYTYDELELRESFSTVQIGAKFEVSAGYCGVDGSAYLAEIFSGFVFSFSLDIKDNVSYLEVSGMDAKLWMMANKFTQFKSSEQTYSKIVQDIENKYSSKFSGATIDIPSEPTSIRPGLHQNDESDFDYLRRIADITGSLFYVVDGEFMFTPIQANGYEQIVIEPICRINEEKFIKKVTFTSNIVGIPKSVSASFTKDEEYNNTTTSEVSSSSNIGSGNTADGLTNNISDSNIIKIFDSSLNSSDCAKLVAQSEYSRRAINLVKCEVVCEFLPDVKIGAPAEMSGFGDIIDNEYIITSLNHKYDGNNFRTTIGLSSDAFS